jgi:DNA (cytosine-5)-methyltransferase 1
MSELEFGSLFSGIGGMDLGLIQAGLKLKWQCENDWFCRQILKKRFGVKVYRDVRSSEFEPVEILAGGFPCQPVSQSGRKLGTEDERWLWPYYLEVIDELHPRWVLIENVDGLRSRGLADILQGLANCGYDAEWDRIPAAAFGAPHVRYRYFILAYPNNLRWNKGSYFKAFGEKQKRAASLIREQLLTDTDSLGRKEKGVILRESSGVDNSAADTNCFIAYPHGKRLAILGQSGKLGSVTKGFDIEGFGWWSVEPDVGRVVHGVSSRVDRLKSLGNAVIPPAGYFLGKLVQFAESKQ